MTVIGLHLFKSDFVYWWNWGRSVSFLPLQFSLRTSFTTLMLANDVGSGLTARVQGVYVRLKIKLKGKKKLLPLPFKHVYRLPSTKHNPSSCSIERTLFIVITFSQACSSLLPLTKDMHRHPSLFNRHRHFPQWGTADAEIKVISAETTIGSFHLKESQR